MPVTLLLVDDHPIIRQGLRHLLENQAEFKVVGEAGDGVEALRLLERLKPDILLVDMMMPGLNGLEVLRQLKRVSPGTRAIVLSMQSADVYVIEAMKNGASGYVLKETGPGELVNAINTVNRGGEYLSPKLSERLQSSGRMLETTPVRDYDTLTIREREILQMTAEGLTSEQIGIKLSISPRTVELHRSNLMTKLGVTRNIELVRYAIRHGIIAMDE